MIKILLATKPTISHRYMIIVFPDYHYLVRWLMEEKNSKHIEKIIKIGEVEKNETTH